MDQTTRARRSSKRKREREPESEDQNEACKVPVVEDPNKDVQSNSTTRSTSSSSQSGWDHDVFLSFRGKDTRKNFTDHLYTNLKRVGIRTFQDDKGLRRGKTISIELRNAIRGSRISIVVFSKGYASSRWCLNELLEIVDCKNTIGHTLLPIFYHVDASDVRNQDGTFKEAFAKHEEWFHTDMKRVQRWREALTEAANCSGWDLKSLTNGYESRFIEQIIEEVLCQVNPARLDVAEHPIGMESRVDHIKDLLNLGTSDDVRIVGIYGMSGIGKTTLAKAVYNEICNKFDGSSFLSNLEESSKKPNGLVHLQEQLLNDILKTNLKISHVHSGINIIEERINGKKVLVILDDVDDFENLHALVKKQWFGSGSRIIVTTRDECLLNKLAVDQRYKVKELNQCESLQLFRSHAFKMANPIEDYFELSIEAVDYAGGLPLALVILGSFLKGVSIAEWKSELKKLQRTPHDKIQKILEMSYDSLNKYTKEIFLDIACFFVGMDKKYVIKILDDISFPSEMGIRILSERSLITIDYQSELKMHDLIRDMGREIVCQASPKYPGERSRLWFHKDVLNVLHKHTGSETVEGLVLNLPEVEDVDLETNAFKKMRKLRLLQINDVDFTGSYEHLSKELKWLCWHKCPRKFLPRDFYLGDLVILDMQHSKVKRVSKTKKIFYKLKVLNLSNSIKLTTLPDFSQVPQLETLILEGCMNLKYLPNFVESSHFENLNLEGCTSLIEIHESIGLLKRLVLLNLRGCKKLRNLSPSISKIKSLKTLVLSECLELKKVPKQLGNMTALTKLNLEKTAIKELPSSFSLLENLEILLLGGCECLIKSPEFSRTSRVKYLELKGCTNLVEIHESIGFLKGLGSLYLDGCQELKNLPNNMSNLKIAELSLRGCSKLQKLPEEFGHKTALCKLKRLSLDECTTLQSFSLPVSVVNLNANGCTSLETILILEDMDTFVNFELNNCYELVGIQSLKSFEFGLNARMEGCISLADDFRNSIFHVLSLSFSNVCLPGSEIPNWIIHQTIGSSLSFRVPPSFDGKTSKVLVCMVYAPTPAYMEAPRETYRGNLNQWVLYNKTKDHPCCVGGWSHKAGFGDHICAQVIDLSSIRNRLKSGDEIHLSVYVNRKLFEVKKCGIHFLVDEPNVRDEDESDFDTCTQGRAFFWTKGGQALGIPWF